MVLCLASCFDAYACRLAACPVLSITVMFCVGLSTWFSAAIFGRCVGLPTLFSAEIFGRCVGLLLLFSAEMSGRYLELST